MKKLSIILLMAVVTFVPRDSVVKTSHFERFEIYMEVHGFEYTDAMCEYGWEMTKN